MANEEQVMIEIKLPFSGFYDSIWSEEITSHIENDIECYNLNDTEENSKLCNDLFMYCDFSTAYNNISREYCSVFNSVIEEYIDAELECVVDLGLEFNEMTSPKEYNFHTDQIYAHANLCDLKKILFLLKHDYDEIIDQLTTRDGFISYYDNTIEEWGHYDEWDYNQWHVILELFINENFKNLTNFDQTCFETDYMYEFLSQQFWETAQATAKQSKKYKGILDRFNTLLQKELDEESEEFNAKSKNTNTNTNKDRQDSI